MYEVIIPKSVVKEIKNFPKSVVEKIQDALLSIAEDPYVGLLLKGDLSTLRKWVIKEQGLQYRIAYTICEEHIEVRVI